MKLKGIKKVISSIKNNKDAIIYYNRWSGKLFVSDERIIFSHCITQMMNHQGYRFDGTMKSLKTFMEANEHYFNKEGGE